jgi:hypothetical protein
VATEYNIRKNLSGAYIIDQTLLEFLIQEAGKRTGAAVSISLELQGNKTLKSENLSDLITDSSLGIRLIRSLAIRSSKYGENGNSISILLDTNRFYSSAVISLSGDKKQISETLRECQDRLDAARAPYNIFHLTWNYATRGIAALAIFAVALYYRIVDLKPTGNDLAQGMSTAAILSAYFIGIYFMLGIVNQFREYFFPQLFFKFGKSGATHSLRIRLLGYVFTAVILAFVIGYATNRLSK